MQNCTKSHQQPHTDNFKGIFCCSFLLGNDFKHWFKKLLNFLEKFRDNKNVIFFPVLDSREASSDLSFYHKTQGSGYIRSQSWGNCFSWALPVVIVKKKREREKKIWRHLQEICKQELVFRMFWEDPVSIKTGQGDSESVLCFPLADLKLPRQNMRMIMFLRGFTNYGS